MPSDRYKCPECGGEFDEPVETTGTSFKLGVGFVKYDADGCPWCGEPMVATARNARKTTLFGGGPEADDVE